MWSCRHCGLALPRVYGVFTGQLKALYERPVAPYFPLLDRLLAATLNRSGCKPGAETRRTPGCAESPTYPAVRRRADAAAADAVPLRFLTEHLTMTAVCVAFDPEGWIRHAPLTLCILSVTSPRALLGVPAMLDTLVDTVATLAAPGGLAPPTAETHLLVALSRVQDRRSSRQ